jgi:hypothetical protein
MPAHMICCTGAHDVLQWHTSCPFLFCCSGTHQVLFFLLFSEGGKTRRKWTLIGRPTATWRRLVLLEENTLPLFPATMRPGERRLSWAFLPVAPPGWRFGRLARSSLRTRLCRSNTPTDTLAAFPTKSFQNLKTCPNRVSVFNFAP